jgi:TonB family protein
MSSSYITNSLIFRRSWLILSLTVGSILAAEVNAQRIAVITPDNSAVEGMLAAAIADSVPGPGLIQDLEMSRTAFESAKIEHPFNMTTDEARRLGRTIGADLYILVRAAVQRRIALGRPDYFEAHAALFIVSSRTGRLIDWRSLSETAPTVDKAMDNLSKRMRPIGNEILSQLKATETRESAEPALPAMEEISDAENSSIKDFRPPVPYRRIKPQYTTTAFLYEIAATVEITIDINAGGEITRAEITRWAGYGLDESVRNAVNSMKWRPAERNNRPIPMRVMLRYNFKKIDK